ncbi:type IIA DNA topoisomerase subunit B [Treponema parvum]|uniref:DNA topoisomerase (ATP-hydrolyzing) n=1 Tax=Treponema parvum TaxID=138851 RepID=A0A975F5D1_9SPIR|nr:toprim domain-containing protein [Treponema parvum]QTQ14618.1 type IIA DNA topoisomerase subunit B [Treponema parvum]
MGGENLKRAEENKKSAVSKTDKTASAAQRSTQKSISNAEQKNKTARKSGQIAVDVTAQKSAAQGVNSIRRKKTSPNTAVYDEDSIQHLEGLEHIRRRPGMYIGSLGDGSDENDGIYILLKEGIDNAVDEFSQGFGNRIDISIDGSGRVRIRDYGRGIPLGKLADCVSKTNTGAKYNDSVFKQAIGMNGVGIKAANALSSYFRAASMRDGKCAVVEFERGVKKSEKMGKVPQGSKDGTYLEFIPDELMFGKYSFNMDVVEKRLWNYVYLNPGLKIVCNGKEYFSENGFVDLLNKEMDGTPLYPYCSFKNEMLEFVFTHTNELDKTLYSYVNGQSTADGGTHVTSFLEGFTKGFNDFYKKNYDIKDVTGGLVGALKISIDNPMFTSQTKNKLGNVEIRSPIIKAVQFAIDDWLRRNPSAASGIEEKIIRNQKAHAEINGVKKEAREAAKKISLKIPKLKDCRYHLQDGKAGEDSMIFITEGDSATGSMVGSRDVRNQAIFSLRGKPENMFGRKQKDIYKNEELYNLMMALGIQENVEDLRYSKIIIATDADNDGFHIRNLVLTFFLLFFEELVTGERVFILETPLFRVRNKTKTVYCYDEETRDKQMKALGAGAEVTRFKGLGEISPGEFGQFIHERKPGDGEDVGMHLTSVSIQTLKNVPKILSFYMGKNTPERRDFIVHHLSADIDA